MWNLKKVSILREFRSTVVLIIWRRHQFTLWKTSRKIIQVILSWGFHSSDVVTWLAEVEQEGVFRVNRGAKPWTSVETRSCQTLIKIEGHQKWSRVEPHDVLETRTRVYMNRNIQTWLSSHRVAIHGGQTIAAVTCLRRSYTHPHPHTYTPTQADTHA